LLPSAADVLAALRKVCAHRSATRQAAAPASAVVAASARTPPAPAAASLAVPEQRLIVRTPRQSPTDEDALLVKFLVKIGDQIATGVKLAELEANKGSFEIEAPCAGRVAELVAREGERIRAGAPLLALDAEGESPTSAAKPVVPAVRPVPLSPAQLRVAALALKSLREIPVASVENEVDLTDLLRQRDELREETTRLLGCQISNNHLVTWAMVQVMKKDRHAGFRGRMDETGQVLLVEPHVHVGFATLGPAGDLYAPVIKQADGLDFAGLVRRMQELTEAVKRGRVDAADLQGATVSLTNIGALDATGGTPFVLPDQVAMLCAGSVQERFRFVRRDGEKEATARRRSVLPLKLVFDHRPFNGSHAGGYLRTLKHFLERLDVRSLLPKT